MTMTAFPLVSDDDLAEATGGPGVVLLDFWQAGCAPCRALELRLEQFSRRHRGQFTGYPHRRGHCPEGHRELPGDEHPHPRHAPRRQRGDPLDGLIHDPDLEQARQPASQPATPG
jgi:thioredoxin 1